MVKAEDCDSSTRGFKSHRSPLFCYILRNPRYQRMIRDPKNIGKRVEFLNRYLSSKLFQDSKQWLESLFVFLRLHQYNGVQLQEDAILAGLEKLNVQPKVIILTRLIPNRKNY